VPWKNVTILGPFHGGRDEVVWHRAGRRGRGKGDSHVGGDGGVRGLSLIRTDPFTTSDGRTIILSRHTQPEADLQLLLHAMKLELPPQPPPRLSAGGKLVGN
jgi:hypothetical protein